MRELQNSDAFLAHCQKTKRNGLDAPLARYPQLARCARNAMPAKFQLTISWRAGGYDD